MLNKGDFKHYLAASAACAEDVRPPRLPIASSPTEDGAEAGETVARADLAKTFLKKTLAEHDRAYHPGGFKPGDKCNFRAAMKQNDIVDDLVAEKPPEKQKLGLVRFTEESDGKRRIVGVVELEEVEKDEGAAKETAEDATARYLATVKD